MAEPVYIARQECRPGRPIVWSVRNRAGETVRHFKGHHAPVAAERWTSDAAELGDAEADRRRNARG